MVMPPFMDDDDVTPTRTSTGEMLPLVRVPLAEIPRTSTRDVVKMPFDVSDTSEEVTPIEVPIPKPPDDSAR